MINQRYGLDITPGKVQPVVMISQFDTARRITFDLYDSNEPYTPNGSAVCRIGDATINTVISGNSVYFDVPLTISRICGSSFGEIVITDNNGQIGSCNFKFIVDSTPFNGGATRFAISYNLATNLVSSNNASTIIENTSYSATISSSNQNYFVNQITVMMGGVDITSSVLDGYDIYIQNVTGALSISATAIALSASSLTFRELNSTQQLAATLIPPDAQAAIVWASSNPNVATVDSTGLVTSVGYGNANISVTVGERSILCPVVVLLPDIVSISAVYTQSGTVYYTDALNSLKSDLVVTATYSDSSTSILEDTDYTLSGSLTVGTSVITVTCEEKTTTFNVTVTDVEWHIATTSDFSSVLSDRLSNYVGEYSNVKIAGGTGLGNSRKKILFGSSSVIERIWVEDTTENPSNITYLTIGGTNVNAIILPTTLTTFEATSVSSLSNLVGLENCHRLTSLNITNTTSLTDVQVADDAPITSMVLQSNTGFVDMSNLNIPSTVTTYRSMFRNCTNLEKVKIPYVLSAKANHDLMCTGTKVWQVDLGDAFTYSTINYLNGISGADIHNYKVTPNSNTHLAFRQNQSAESPQSPVTTIYVTPKTGTFTNAFIWGDSLTRMTDGGEFPTKLANMLTDDVIVNNFGVAGASATNLNTTFQKYKYSRGDINVFFLGHNSGATNAMNNYANWIPELSGGYIVMGLVTKSYTTASNATMAETYGNHFLDTHNYMIQYGFSITGLTPTEQDTTDIANGNVPHSFLQDDYVHLNEYGAMIVATALKEKLLSLGYITNSQIVTD